MSIDNGIVVLPDSIPVTMRFSAMTLTDGRRKDPVTGFVSSVKRFSSQVVEVDGNPVHEIFDSLSEKLWMQLMPYANDPNLIQRQFTITKTGSGYLTQYTIAVQ